MLLRTLLLATLALAPTARAADKAQVEAAAAKIAIGQAVLLDVREADEIKDGMAGPAMWLPTSAIKAQGTRFKDIMKNLPKDKPVYVYCASGGRAGRFVDELKQKGYQAESL